MEGVTKREWGNAAFVILVIVIVLSVIGQIPLAKYNETLRWRAWTCAKADALLVSDTLCVTPNDSSWRVSEPPR